MLALKGIRADRVQNPRYGLLWPQAQAIPLGIDPDDAIATTITQPEIIGVLERTQAIERSVTESCSLWNQRGRVRFETPRQHQSIPCRVSGRL